MKTYDELETRWKMCRGGQILVDSSHPLKMYLNLNEVGHRELLIPVIKPIKMFQPTAAIDVKNYRVADKVYFAIELLDDSLVREYVCLCFDLIESSRKAKTQETALDILILVFRRWYAILNKVQNDILAEHELRGLMGEVKFVIDSICEGKDSEEIINAWTIHKDAERDFVFDSDWYEIKTVASSSDYVSISSLEQLYHDCDGYLVIYRLDKTDNERGITINSLVEQLRSMLNSNLETMANRVLLSKGYVNNDAYQKYKYFFSNEQRYTVNDSFPRITHEDVPDAIIAARYDISIRKIENWRVKNDK